MPKLCPCYSQKEYSNCCKPFHNGIVPENALQLMRSRYSAYALNLPDYIMTTTHPDNPHYSKDKNSWRKNISQFSENSVFSNLKILEFVEKMTSATVTFIAYISQHGHDVSFTEKSYFEKVNGKWLYKNGQFISKPTDS